MVVPQAATVQLVGCKAWCEIVYKGRRGYVYKDFLGGSRSAPASSQGRQGFRPDAKPKSGQDRRQPADVDQAKRAARRGDADGQAAFVPVAMTSTLPTATSARPAIA